MARGDREVRQLIDAIGIEVIKELVGKPEATENEIRLRLRQAVTNWKRHREITVAIKPYENEGERLESILDWLNRPSSEEGGRNAGDK